MRLRAYAGLLLVVAAAWAAAPAAVTIAAMDVGRDGDRYTVHADMRLDVPRALAWRAATDYERLPEFNPSVVRMKALGGNRLQGTLRLCVAFFCKTIEQRLGFREESPRRLTLRAIPDSGDLRYGRFETRFSAASAPATRLVFDAQVQPDFWVPPVIGPWLIARALEQQARVTAESIERLAHEYADPAVSNASTH